jgi:hypothetical protein
VVAWILICCFAWSTLEFSVVTAHFSYLDNFY